MKGGARRQNHDWNQRELLCATFVPIARAQPPHFQNILRTCSIQEQAEQHTASKANVEDMTQPVPQTSKYTWLSVGRIVQLRSVYPHLSNMVLQLMDKAFKVSKQSVSKQSSFSSLLKSATSTTWGQMEEKYTTELWQCLTTASEKQIKWLMKVSASNYKKRTCKEEEHPSYTCGRKTSFCLLLLSGNTLFVHMLILSEVLH